MAEETAATAERKQDLPWWAAFSLDDIRCFIYANLKQVARSVVAVGYYLKQVRDRELWKEAGEAEYASVWDFASHEFGISKSSASRYMAINDRFSEGGNSPLIMEKYAELSKSQLQEMLYLTDQQAEMVTPSTTVQQIRALRNVMPEKPVVVLEGQMSFEDLGISLHPDDNKIVVPAMPAPIEDAGQRATSAPAEPVIVTVDDLIPEEDAEEDDVVAISQQEAEDKEGNNEIPQEIIELIYLKVHNYKVEIRRIIDDNPEIDPQDIVDCAKHFMVGGI